MNIGILTFHASHNCGSMLQAFALQYVLQRESHAKVEIIDYSNRMSRTMYGLFDTHVSKSALFTNVKRLRHFYTYYKYRNDYIDFSNRFLAKSDKRFENVKHLRKYVEKYDIIIAGGDQIWNVRCPDAGIEYFLNFSDNVRKVSFSPSLGGTNILDCAEDVEIYRKLLNKFELLSVREPNGKKWLEKLTNREVKIVSDPTLLLTKEEWYDVLPIPEFKGKYIFCYAFYHNNNMVNENLKLISERMGMPIVIMDTKSFEFYSLDKYGFVKHSHSGPLAFLGLMKNASLVLTQSFHGTLFASLFNKKFWSYNIPAYMKSDDDRAIALLDSLGVPSRYILIEDLLKKNIMEELDYKTINDNISCMRNDALQYLHSIIGPTL